MPGGSPRFPILLLARELEAGGSERQLAETALGLDRSRFDPYVGTFRPHSARADQLRAAGIPVIHFPVYSFRSRGALVGAWRLARFIRAKKIQLVHTFDAPLTAFATPVVRYLTRALMVSSQRGHRQITPEYARLLRWTDRRVDGIVVNCQFLKRYLIEEEHVAERLVRVSYNGIDLETFSPGGAERPASLPTDSLVIGVACVLRPEKGLGTLIDAFARVRTLSPHMKLVLVGSGSELLALQERARTAGIFEDCVWQPHTADVVAWLRNFDVFVLPSLSEGLSNSLMEAMACGCAAIASNAGGNPELIGSGRGLLFESGDASSLAAALARLIQDPDLRQRLGTQARRFVRENFSRETAAGHMGEIYESFLDKRRS